MTKEEEFYQKMMQGAFQQAHNARNIKQPDRIHPSEIEIDTFIHRCIEELDYTYPELLQAYQDKVNNTGVYQNSMVSTAEVMVAPDILSRLRYLVRNPNTKLNLEA